MLIPRRRATTFPDEFAAINRWLADPACVEPELVAQWEQAVAKFVGADHGAAVNSGRRGLSLALRRLAPEPGEVIIPAYTLKDLLGVVTSAGFHPVPADIEPRTFNVSAQTVSQCLSTSTKAILVLHAFGAPCPADEITELARARGIPVIEDCAHALGATLNGRACGTFGDAGFYSFEPTKPIGTYGGGMVVSADAGLAEHIRVAVANDPIDYTVFQKKMKAVAMEQTMFNHGLAWPMLFMMATPMLKTGFEMIYRRMQSVPPAIGRYTPIQARLGLMRLEGLPERLARRNQNAAFLAERLRPEFQVQQIIPGGSSAWYFFTVLVPGDGAAVRRALLLRGIDAAVGAEILDDCAALLGNAQCPVTADVYRRAIALPMFDGIEERQLARVANVLNSAGAK